MPGQERAAAKAPGDRDSGTYNHKPKGRQKAARNSNIALHSITHTYRMERLPGIEPRYKRNGLPYSYHINKDTKEKIASGLKVTIRQTKPRRLLATGAGVFCFLGRGRRPLISQRLSSLEGAPSGHLHGVLGVGGVNKQPSHGSVRLGIEIIEAVRL